MQAHGEPVYIDVAAMANPGTRGRNIRYRVAASVGWKARFTICWENSLISFEEMSAICGMHTDHQRGWIRRMKVAKRCKSARLKTPAKPMYIEVAATDELLCYRIPKSQTVQQLADILTVLFKAGYHEEARILAKEAAEKEGTMKAVLGALGLLLLKQPV